LERTVFDSDLQLFIIFSFGSGAYPVPCINLQLIDSEIILKPRPNFPGVRVDGDGRSGTCRLDARAALAAQSDFKTCKIVTSAVGMEVKLLREQPLAEQAA
jgi:hypothetical protein